MNIPDFLDRAHARGHVITRNGPRLYIEAVRHRFALTRGIVSQRVYIDLSTYTAHCVTESPTHGPAWCKRQSAEVVAKLAPLARLARIHRVTANGAPPIVTQSRLLYGMLHSAGVPCSLESSRLVIDIDLVARMAQAPLIPAREGYEVCLRPTGRGELFSRRFDTREALVRELRGDPMQGLELVVTPAIGHNEETTGRILRAARSIIKTTIA